MKKPIARAAASLTPAMRQQAYNDCYLGKWPYCHTEPYLRSWYCQITDRYDQQPGLFDRRADGYRPEPEMNLSREDWMRATEAFADMLNIEPRHTERVAVTLMSLLNEIAAFEEEHPSS